MIDPPRDNEFFRFYSQSVCNAGDIIKISDNLDCIMDSAVVKSKVPKNVQFVGSYFFLMQGEFFGQFAKRLIFFIQISSSPIRGNCMYKSIGFFIVLL